MLKINTTLQSVNLENNKFNDNSANTVAEALVHSNIRSLKIDDYFSIPFTKSKDTMSASALAGLVSGDMPIDLHGGEPINHHHSWTYLVSQTSANAGEAVQILLAAADADPPGCGYGTRIVALAETLDANERTALQLAAMGPKRAVYAHLLFCGRYELHSGPPEHRSATSVVLRAYDRGDAADYSKVFDAADKDRSNFLERAELEAVVEQLGLSLQMLLGPDADKVECLSREQFIPLCRKQLGDGPRPVVLKFMQDEVQWKREKEMREEKNLDPQHVVQVLKAPEDDEVATAVGTSMLLKQWTATHLPENIGLGKRVIAMDAADRNLLQIYQQERPDINKVRVVLQEVGYGIAHLHDEQLMHGDIKSLNAVRAKIDGKMRLIDFDASEQFSTHSVSEKSFAGAKFSSAVLPPELIYQLRNAAERDTLSKYWATADKELQGKVASLDKGKLSFVVKSFRVSNDGNPITEGLPYDLVEASSSIDCWAFGALAYMLCTGEPLFPSTRDDDCASGEAMAALYDWGEKVQFMRRRLDKVPDPAASNLIAQLLRREPEDRLMMADALEHPFFHTDRSESEMDDSLKKKIDEMNERTKRMEEEQHKQTTMLTTIQSLSLENRSELSRTRDVLLKGFFEATEMHTPTCFVVLDAPLPELSEDDKKLQLQVAEDGSGVSATAWGVGISVSDEGITVNSEVFDEYKGRFDEAMEWADCLKGIGSKFAEGGVGDAFETIKDGLGDLVTGERKYLYLVDDLTGEPVRGEGYPLTITKPSELVPKLLPLMQVGLRGMAIYNGAAGVARMFGFPAPKVPEDWRNGTHESVEVLKQESSVEQFGAVHHEVMGGGEESKSVRGKSLREFVDFLSEYDPGLKAKKQGAFAGLRRLGDPEDGTAVWTTLTDPAKVKAAIEARAKERRSEVRSQEEAVREARKLQQADAVAPLPGAPHPAASASRQTLDQDAAGGRNGLGPAGSTELQVARARATRPLATSADPVDESASASNNSLPRLLGCFGLAPGINQQLGQQQTEVIQALLKQLAEANANQALLTGQLTTQQEQANASQAQLVQQLEQLTQQLAKLSEQQIAVNVDATNVRVAE
mmetsp:Transcript_74809/g.206351  ORF Transcript_74809/g.206351 Transcript_74809/m.206351 type:complete len:1089 (+) Transcript_74809:132-3398(+)